MTVSFGYYNSQNGDRRYDAVDQAEMFEALIEDGVHRGIGTEFEIIANGGLGFTLGKGRCWFDKTWTYNDAPVQFVLDDADAALSRVDTLILETNSNLSVRANTFKLVRGIPSSNPVRSTLTRNEVVNQYPVVSFLRTPGSTSIPADSITTYLGTPDFPYAVGRLLDREGDPSDMHRNVFRGKNLGAVVTAAQSSAIANETFDDLYIGDYWEIRGKKWRIVDFNYFLGSGQPENIKPHVVVMPDDKLGSSAWNASRSTSAGYVSSTLDKYLSATAFPIITLAFGAAHILETRTVYVNGTNSSGVATTDAWYNTKAQTPSGIMMFGNTWYKTSRTEAATQLALFRLAPKYIKSSDKDSFWLRDVADNGYAALVAKALYPTTSVASVSDQAGVRPLFCVI